jgi:sugar lactone lactonase YvrE
VFGFQDWNPPRVDCVWEKSRTAEAEPMRLTPLIFASAIPHLMLAQSPSTASFLRPIMTVDSIPAPESVAIGPDGSWYVSSFGKFAVKGDGAVYRVTPEGMKAEVYAGGLDDPTGLLFVGDTLWVADRGGVYRVQQGRVDLVYAAASFPRRLNFLNDLAIGAGGTIYVSDTGDSASAGAVFVLESGKRPSLLPGSDTATAQSSVNGLHRGGGDTLYTVGFRTGVLSVTDGHGAWRELARGLGAPDGIVAAGESAFYVTDNDGGILFLVPRAAGRRVVTLARGLKAPADLVVDRTRGWLVIPENQGNRLSVYQLSG